MKTKISIKEEAPNPTLSISSFQYGVGYAGESVSILSGSCDVWIGADKIAAWRDAIPKWRRLSNLCGGTISIYSYVPAFITSPDGNFVAPSFPIPIGSQNSNIVTPDVTLPPALADSYFKVDEFLVNEQRRPFIPHYLSAGWNMNALNVPGWDGVTGNPFYDAPIYPQLVQSGPTAPALVMFTNSNMSWPINNIIDQGVGASVLNSWCWAYSGYGRTNQLPMFFDMIFNGTYSGTAVGEFFLVLTTGIKLGPFVTIFDIPANGVSTLLPQSAYPMLYIPVGTTCASTTVDFTCHVRFEWMLPRWPLYAGGAHDCWSIGWGWRRSATSAITIASSSCSYTLGIAKPNLLAPTDQSSQNVVITPG